MTKKEKLLYKLFEKVNKELFNNELETPLIKTINMVEMVGLSLMHFDKLIPFEGITIHQYGREFVAIQESLTGDEAFFCMVHEMVHVWQAQNNMPLDHKKEFKKKCIEAFELYC